MKFHRVAPLPLCSVSPTPTSASNSHHLHSTQPSTIHSPTLITIVKCITTITTSIFSMLQQPPKYFYPQLPSSTHPTINTISLTTSTSSLTTTTTVQTICTISPTTMTTVQTICTISPTEHISLTTLSIGPDSLSQFSPNPI
jgi:hypothetical protein